MVDGNADITISYVSEILPIKGAKLVGPLPAAIQSPAVFTGAVGAASANPEAARALLRAMAGPEGRGAIMDAGLEPLGAR
jgi:molybdate transport system substrate-binding protein